MGQVIPEFFCGSQLGPYGFLMLTHSHAQPSLGINNNMEFGPSPVE